MCQCVVHTCIIYEQNYCLNLISLVFSLFKVRVKVRNKVRSVVKVRVKIKSDFIGHIHMVSRCYCECSEMLVLLVPTV